MFGAVLESPKLPRIRLSSWQAEIGNKRQISKVRFKKTDKTVKLEKPEKKSDKLIFLLIKHPA